MYKTAKRFLNGCGPSVRLPAGFRLVVKDVAIEFAGDAVILSPTPAGWDDFFAAPTLTPADFLADREDQRAQDRNSFHDLDA